MAPANRAAFDQRRHCVRDIGVMDDTLLRLPCPSSGLPPLFYPYSCRVLYDNFYFVGIISSFQKENFATSSMDDTCLCFRSRSWHASIGRNSMVVDCWRAQWTYTGHINDDCLDDKYRCRRMGY